MLPIFLLIGAIAGAAEPVCPATPAAIQSGAKEAKGHYEDFEFEAFQTRYEQLVAEVRCASAPLLQDAVFQVYELQVIAAQLSKDHGRMVATLRGLLAVRPDYLLPEDLAAPGSALDAAFQEARAITDDPSRPLVDAGTWYVDGDEGNRNLPEARAALIQHAASDTDFRTWLVDGGSLPRDLTRLAAPTHSKKSRPAAASATSPGAV